MGSRGGYHSRSLRLLLFPNLCIEWILYPKYLSRPSTSLCNYHLLTDLSASILPSNSILYNYVTLVYNPFMAPLTLRADSIWLQGRIQMA